MQELLRSTKKRAVGEQSKGRMFLEGQPFFYAGVGRVEVSPTFPEQGTGKKG